MSVLVHEMVHHIESQGNLKYKCPQALEKLAYAAQARWLAGFGLTLESEFAVDPLPSSSASQLALSRGSAALSSETQAPPPSPPVD